MDELHTVLEECFRQEWPRLVAAASRIVGDVAAGEELAQEVLITALARWPFAGVPERPGAWLLTAVRNKAKNRVRDLARERSRLISLGRLIEHDTSCGDLQDTTDDALIGDERLRLMVACCDPQLPLQAQTALTLRLVAGLSTRQIAAGFVEPEASTSQRLVRAKRRLRSSTTGFGATTAEELQTRIPSVVAAIYSMFAEAHSATSGNGLVVPTLCSEAIRLARLLCDVAPAEPEVWALAALLTYQSSRLATRVDAAGDLVPLADQDRTCWDHRLIDEGDASLARSIELGGPGPLALQAMIAAVHAHSPTWELTHWEAIVAAYDRLVTIDADPIVALNRAAAISYSNGPDAGLTALDALVEAGTLGDYHLLWATRADLNRRAGRFNEAATDYDRALRAVANKTERRYLERRHHECLAAMSPTSTRWSPP